MVYCTTADSFDNYWDVKLKILDDIMNKYEHSIIYAFEVINSTLKCRVYPFIVIK